jgi:hypothetical protein
LRIIDSPLSFKNKNVLKSLVYSRFPGLEGGINSDIVEGVLLSEGGCRNLYGGLSAGLQRQMCFASVRLGLYDSVKTFYAGIIDGISC